MEAVSHRGRLITRHHARLQTEHEPAPGWNVNFLPLEPGQFTGDVRLVESHDVQVMHTRLNRRSDQRGNAPDGRITFSVSHESTRSFIWAGQEVTSSSVMWFPAGSSIEAVAQSDFNVYTVSLPQEMLEDIVGPRINRIYDQSDMNRMGFVIGDSVRIDELRRRIRHLLQSGRNANRATDTSICVELPIAIMDALQSPASDPRRSTRFARVHDLAKAIEYARTNAMDAPTVKELGDAVGMNERTLRHAFLEHVGMSPKAYVQALRLESVRQQLLTGSQPDALVADIANKWGFWHMGQFASDYRKRFGELPSDTLRAATSLSD